MTYEQEQKLNQITRNDAVYQKCLAECEGMEEAYSQMRNRLSAADQEILDRYISLCEELEYRRTCLAMEMVRA